MKQLQKSDLKVSEIYKLKAHNREYLYRISDMRTSMTLCNDGYLIIDTNHFNKISNISQSHDFADAKYIEIKEKYEFYNATPEEKHWLEACIKADKFVSYEEATKTLIPEYVECIIADSLIEVGKVYKTTGLKDWGAPYNDGCNKVYTLEIGNDNPYYTSQFKPSTKEAYDAQFVVKEPEFVLPEIWWVRITKENLKDISKFLDFNLGEYAIGFVAGMVKSGITGIVTKGYNPTPTTSYGSTFVNEITYDQFKQYVLKENTTVTEKPKVVLEEPKYDILVSNEGKYIGVQCPEGGIYRIGDKITVFDKYSPNKGKPFTIKSFRWTNDKSKICAVTELHTTNGIGLDKIELYVKPKVKQELSLLEQAKLKYPIGTKIISPTSKSTHIIKGDIRYGCQNTSVCNYIFGNDGGCTLYNANTNQWAEIVDDFVLPEKWCVEVNHENQNFISSVRDRNCYSTFITSDLILPDVKNSWWCNMEAKSKGFTEITLEQFKKYVLKDE